MVMLNIFKSPAASAGAIRLGVVSSGFAPKFSSALPPGGLETEHAPASGGKQDQQPERQMTPDGMIRIPLTGARLRALRIIHSSRKRVGSL